MKTQIPKEYWKSQGPPMLISYKPDPTISNTTTDKSDSLKVDIKTQPGESKNETVEIYVTLFWKKVLRPSSSFSQFSTRSSGARIYPRDP